MSAFEINSYLGRALPYMERRSRQETLIPFAELMVMYAKERSPHVTGHNRDSIRIDPIVLPDDPRELAVVTESGYGGWLEVGTSRRPATPYFAPAFDQAKTAMGL